MGKTKDRKTTKAKTCDCAKLVNDELKAHNTALNRELQVNFKTGQASMSPPQLATHKVNPLLKGKVMTVYPTFCPFCGKKYPEA